MSIMMMTIMIIMMRMIGMVLIISILQAINFNTVFTDRESEVGIQRLLVCLGLLQIVKYEAKFEAIV